MFMRASSIDLDELDKFVRNIKTSGIDEWTLCT
jgi:hypothetical protein